MSTRGIKGFKLDEKFYGIFNRYDSYPRCLGWEMLNIAKDVFESEKSIEKAKRNIRLLEMIDPDNEDYDHECFYDLTQETDYISDLFDGKHTFMLNEIDFAKNSLFCEYGYFIDFDNQELMLFNGFQREPQDENPFGVESDNDGYYPIKYLGSFNPFEITIEEMVNIFGQEE